MDPGEKVDCLCGANQWQAKLVTSEVGGHHSLLLLHCVKCGRTATIAHDAAVNDIGFAISQQ